jgi:hypothetical protein
MSNIFNINQIKPNDLKTKNVIIGISSLIYVNPDKSKISIKERFSTTLESLKNIKNKLNDKVTVVLLEMSQDILAHELLELSQFTDYIITFFNDSNCIKYAFNHPYKGSGETYSLIKLHELLEEKDFGWFIKLGGRYNICNNFDLNNYLLEYPTCLRSKYDYISHGFITQTPFCVESIIFSIPKEFCNSYLTYFRNMLNNENKIIFSVEEQIVYYFLEIKNYILLENANIYGSGATNGICKIY